MTGLMKRLIGEKKQYLLILLMVLGLIMVLLSYIAERTPNTHAQDITYTEGSVEARLAKVLSQIEGAGEVEVLVMEDDGGVMGVLVVADGANELSVRTDLTRAAMTAMDIPAQSVEVFARQKEDKGSS